MIIVDISFTITISRVTLIGFDAKESSPSIFKWLPCMGYQLFKVSGHLTCMVIIVLHKLRLILGGYLSAENS
jgi:hypothetical protein